MRRPSNAARDLVARNEGLRLRAYADPGTGGEPWTIGYGHTRGVRPGMVITQQQALDFLAEDMLEAVAMIYRHAPAAIVDAAAGMFRCAGVVRVQRRARRRS